MDSVFFLFFPIFISNTYPNLAKLFSGWLPLWLQHKILKKMKPFHWRNEGLQRDWVDESPMWYVVSLMKRRSKGLGWCNSQPDLTANQSVEILTLDDGCVLWALYWGCCCCTVWIVVWTISWEHCFMIAYWVKGSGLLPKAGGVAGPSGWW
jgi:hypothetical protein